MDLIQEQQHNARVSITIALAAAAAAVGFHFLFFKYQYGIAFALFMVILVAVVHVLTIISGKRGNLWAYIFIVPLILSLTAEILHASMVVRGAGFVIAVGSLTFFTYWFTAPRIRFWDTQSLWPTSLFTESFFPFPRFGQFVNELIKGKKHTSKILTGVAIAIPFLLVIGLLFVSADAFIQKTLNDFFSAQNLQQSIVRAIWDIVAFVFFASGGWVIVSRLIDQRRPVHHAYNYHLDHVVATTFLVLLNILFAIFIGFQIVYFFGGQDFIQAQGITYSDYAREGFFQLLWVSVIVVGIIAGVYRYTGMKHWLIRGFSILLALQTGVVIVSALRRMMLYIDAYGLSVQRFWATYGIYVIAAVLLIGIIAIIGNVAYDHVVKAVSVLVLIVASVSLLMNVEGIVADYNVNRYLSGKTDKMDVWYLISLSSDALPSVVRLAQEREGMDIGSRANQKYSRIEDVLKTEEEVLRNRRDKDWRELVFSDYNALAALGGLK